jgi:hypothetical protein
MLTLVAIVPSQSDNLIAVSTKLFQSFEPLLCVMQTITADTNSQIKDLADFSRRGLSGFVFSSSSSVCLFNGRSTE